MRKYKKIKSIEVIGHFYSGEKLPNGSPAPEHGYWVQNEGDHSDTWFIDQVIFDNTYEEIA